MEKIVVDGFELRESYIQLLLDELKNDGIETKEELKKYFQDHWYTKDSGRKCHLLISKYPKKRNFAIPFDD